MSSSPEVHTTEQHDEEQLNDHDHQTDLQNNHHDDDNGANITKLLWSEFMNRVGLDVFQFILSFLPPIPYLFQLKRVSSHWKELCEECMKEDCTELFWDQKSSLVVLNILKFNLKDYAQRIGLPEQYENELFPQKNNNHTVTSYLMFGFLRNVLMSFNKLRSITFKNLELNAPLLYLIFVEWGKELESIKFIQCSVELMNVPRSIRYSNAEEVIEHINYHYDMNPKQFISVKLKGDRNRPALTTLFDKMKESKLKNINFYHCFDSPLYGYAHTMSTDLITPFELIGIISCIDNLESAYYDLPSSISTSSSFDNLAIFKKLVPNVKFNIPCTAVASKMLLYSKYEEVRKIRNLQEFEHFHNNVVPTLVKFFQVYSPFGLDTELKDIQGFNILHMALSSELYLVIYFIFDYFTFYNEDSNNVEDSTRILNHLFAGNNRLDGRNSTFIVITKEKLAIMDKMMEHLVHFNAQDREGLTVAHYYAQFGQLSKLKSLIAILDKLPTVAERKYFLDFNIANNEGETAVTICYKYKMFALLRYLSEIAPRYDIQNIPENIPQEIVLTADSFKAAFEKKSPPKIPEPPPKKSCTLM